MILPILLLGLGLAFVVAEVLFPSFGVLSVLATLSIVAAVALAFRDSTEAGVKFLVAVVILVPAMIMLGLKVFPQSPIGRKMVVSGLSFESEDATDPRDLDLVGEVGEVEAPCRPAGMARIGSRRVDVVTRGEFIERGERVRVSEVKGNRVVVVRAPAEDSA